VLIDALEKNEVALVGAHSDFASITLLLQDAVGGLEFEDPNHPSEFKVHGSDTVIGYHSWLM